MQIPMDLIWLQQQRKEKTKDVAYRPFGRNKTNKEIVALKTNLRTALIKRLKDDSPIEYLGSQNIINFDLNTIV